MKAEKVNIEIELFTRIKDKDQNQELQQQLEGQIYEKEDQTYIRYEEDLEGIGKVSNTLKIEGKLVKVIRHGAVTMNHVYQLGKTTSGWYHSPHGPLEMETNTTKLEYVPMGEGLGNGIGSFELRYDLSLNGQDAGRFTLDMRFKQ